MCTKWFQPGEAAQTAAPSSAESWSWLPSAGPPLPAPETSSFDWTGLAKDVGEGALKYGLPVAATIYGARQQAGMGEDLARAQEQSYQNYLQAINPPEPVQEARFNELRSQIVGAAPAAQRRLTDTMASRGIKRRGLVSPLTQQQLATQDAVNQAYRQIYGTYNVPSAPGPVAFTPSTTQLLGSQAGQLGGIDLMRKLYSREA